MEPTDAHIDDCWTRTLEFWVKHAHHTDLQVCHHNMVCEYGEPRVSPNEAPLLTCCMVTGAKG